MLLLILHYTFPFTDERKKYIVFEEQQKQQQSKEGKNFVLD
jgi:hypothetical protein